MALPASGAISLNAIHIEVGGSSGTLCTINDSDIRGLIGKSSGATSSFSEFYGASSRGEQTYTTPGTYTWTAPFSGAVCILCIGAGSDGSIRTSYDGGVGGGGGALAYKNNYTVSSGTSYTVIVPNRAQYGTDPGDAQFKVGSTIICGADSATSQARGSSGTGDNTENGGNGGGGGTDGSGGGGCAGYTGAGGNGEQLNWWGNVYSAATSGSGGGGGGGGAYGTYGGGSQYGGGGGGGVGIYGAGSNGSAGTGSGAPGGGGGSGGGNGGNGVSNGAAGNGGSYGGGGGGQCDGYGANAYPIANSLGGFAGSGVVRIIWGSGRAFPSTDTGV